MAITFILTPTTDDVYSMFIQGECFLPIEYLQSRCDELAERCNRCLEKCGWSFYEQVSKQREAARRLNMKK
jgi:hypothetical protein